MDSCEKAMLAGRRITDMAGREVIVPEVIRTVYAASLYGYTMLCSLAPEMLVATPFLPRDCDRKYLHPNLHNLPVIEKITDTDGLAAVNPDVVIVWADKENPYHKKSEEALNKLNIPFVYVIVGDLGDLPDYPDAYAFLGKLLGKADRAAKLSEYCQKALQEVAAVVNKIPDRLRPGVYYAECEDGLATEYDDSLHVHLLKLLGDVNVHRGHTTEHKGMEKISFEQITAYNPDVIVAWNRAFTQNILRDPVWSDIRAVRDCRVYAIPNVPFNWFDRPPSFMRILGLKWLTSCLYPDDYAIDMIKETQDFYSLYLGVNITADDARKIIAQETA
ncbi:MAG: ABC transporter substrate-binding protein [Candidatus Riflebacteria bacterium]|nr:ABC transporter substrate-binding protein [Candidatus Riflebacteria bacterium]